MVSRLCFFVILCICLSTSFTDPACQGMPRCTCSKEQLACDDIEDPLDLKALNSTITKVVLSNTFINGALFSTDSEVQHITELSLVGCNMTNIDPHAFSNMKSLNSLSISYGSNFQNVNLTHTALENLNLTQCGLSFSDFPLMKMILQQVPKLKKLVLSKNNFRNLSASILYPLKDLKVLHAQECGIENVLAEEFNFEAQLVEVDLSDNRLTRLPTFLFHSSKESLQELTLTGNPMSKIDLSFADFKSLNSLKIDGMNLNCSCSWIVGLSSKVIEPSDVKCQDFESSTYFNLVDFMSQCEGRKNDPEEEESSKSLVIVIIILVVVAVVAAVGCLVHRILSNRRRRAQEKKTVRYSAVYRETVESSAPPPKVVMG